jgi:hypothetical protein
VQRTAKVVDPVACEVRPIRLQFPDIDLQSTNARGVVASYCVQESLRFVCGREAEDVLRKQWPAVYLSTYSATSS